jgi:hypothetical protein
LEPDFEIPYACFADGYVKSPATSPSAPLSISVTHPAISAVGGYIPFKITLQNREDSKQGMVLIHLGIPGGVEVDFS